MHRLLLILGFGLFSPCSLLLSQDINAILAVQQIDTMLYSGPKDNRINWVIQNRGSEFIDRAEFVDLYRHDLLLAFEPGHILEQIPFAQYRHFFNLYAYWWPDALDDGTGWHFGIIKGLRDAIFLPWANDETGWATFFSTTRHGGGGGAGLDRNARVGDGKMYGMGWETFLHEFNHTMPGLLDEYSSDGSWSNGQCWETPNTTGQLVIDDIPWRRWINEGTPLPTPYTEEYVDQYGAFEGAMTNYFGCHRPTARGCYMGAGGFGEEFGQELCSPCVQRVICFLYQYVHVIENPLPAAHEIDISGEETITFSVDVVKPEPNTHQYRWILNGKVIATQTESVDVTFDVCEAYELVFEVHDTNTLVRYDPKFEHIYPNPIQRRTWTIHQNDINTYSLESLAQTHDVDCRGLPDGIVDFTITGGQPPYTIYHHGNAVSNPASNLSVGQYLFDIVDANGCRVTNDISIGSDPTLDPQLCTSFHADQWTLSVEDNNYSTDELSYAWSTGSTALSITVAGEGTYFVDITTADGCTVRRTISLSQAAMALDVHETHFPTSVDAPTGKIYLDIRGGRLPYTIMWEDKINHDLTDTNTNQIISSGSTWGHDPRFAFDNSRSTKWLHAVAQGAFIGYRLPAGEIVNYYAITSADDVPERDPRHWEFQGSLNGIDWVSLDQQMDHVFDKRYERRGFLFANTTPYVYYRLYVHQNYGDIATQIQELEIVGVRSGDDFISNSVFLNKDYRSHLEAGLYRYIVKDANAVVYSDSVTIGYVDSSPLVDLKVVQDGECQVAIETPDADVEYYWFPDQEGSIILHIGGWFRPLHTGNYYVGAMDRTTHALSTPLKGFAVTVVATPEVYEVVADTTLAIVNPDPALTYLWYDQDQCGGPVHIGSTFSPSEAGTYYVSAQWSAVSPDPVDPASLSGVIVRMDAADLDGDQIIDSPSPPTSSMHDWIFSNGNAWADHNWFAFRSNFQNGLGIVDFATIWLQRLQHSETGYQTILMAYQENPLSFPETAPFEGLSRNIPRHSDASQIYGNTAPGRTVEGSTYLNGEWVDPFTTPHPMEFCILGTVMTEVSNDALFYTDTHWEGKIGEIILYDRALTQEEMEGASAYLRQKWMSVADLQSPVRVLQWDGILLQEATIIRDLKEVLIYPNPTTGEFRIEGMGERYTVQLIDSKGNRVKQYAAGSQVFDMAGLPVGSYFVKINNASGEKTWVQQVIKIE